jgi:hypothetical protein
VTYSRLIAAVAQAHRFESLEAPTGIVATQKNSIKGENLDASFATLDFEQHQSTDAGQNEVAGGYDR